MAVPARRKHAPATSDFEFDDDDAQESPFYAGERICAPSPNTGKARKALASAL